MDQGWLAGFFLTNAIVAEMIGGKLIYVGGESWRIPITDSFVLGPFAMSVGILPWPVVFLTTDLINEYFGRRGVRRLTFLTAAMIGYAFLILSVTMGIKATSFSGIDDASYERVFDQGRWMIAGSLAAFLISQLIDVFVFHLLRRRTGKARLWLRSTGSTVVSQLIDSIVVLYIGLAIPRGWDFQTFVSTALPNYTVKLCVALLATPLIYIGHWAVETYLGKSVAEAIAEQAARESEGGGESPVIPTPAPPGA